MMPQHASPSTTPLLAYIACSSYAGSTLLGLLLAQHPAIAATSQIEDLPLAVRHPRDLPCTCGHPVAQCDHWQRVAATMAGQQRITAEETASLLGALPLASGSQIAGHRPADRWLRWLAMAAGTRDVFGRLEPYAASLQALNRSAHAWLQVADAVGQTTGARVVVDASKSTDLPVRLAQLAPERLRLLYLVRDGRAVMLSRMRRRGESAAQAARTWAHHNLRLLWLRAGLPHAATLTVRYEDLCATPRAELLKILQFLDLSDHPLDGPLDKQAPHLVGGNPMRYDVQQRSIALDTRWQTQLTTADLRAYWHHAGVVHRALGYPSQSP